jgi:hypothetical protein
MVVLIPGLPLSNFRRVWRRFFVLPCPYSDAGYLNMAESID